MNEVSLLSAHQPSVSMKPIMTDATESVAHKIEWMKTAYGLTATEYRILQYLARGNSPQEIAQMTDSALPTVRTHMNNIYRKTRVTKVVGLMALMLKGPDSVHKSL